MILTTGNGISVNTQMTIPLAMQSAWIAVHLVGLLLAWLARVHGSSGTRWFAQAGFFIFLPLIAMLTIAGQYLSAEAWPLSAITLTVMIVMAVVDFGTDRESRIASET